MTYRIGLFLVACCACGAAHAQRMPSRSSSTVVALGTASAVLDVIEADLRGRDCLTVARGRDSTGVDGINAEDTCLGRYNIATIRTSRAGAGRVRVTTESAFVVDEDRGFVSLPGLPSAALHAARVPAVTEPVAESGVTPCGISTDEKLLNLAKRFAAAPDSTEERLTGDETMPEFARGFASFQRSIRYPEEARRASMEGRTIVQFVVEEDGQITCAELLVSIHPALNAEALRAVRAARFTPGTQDGKPVRVRMSLPVIFNVN